MFGVNSALEPLPLGLAADWVKVLLHRFRAIRSKRKEDLAVIRNSFVDPELLVHHYIEPDCQLINPADLNEHHPFPTWSARIPIRNRLNDFLRGPGLDRDGRNTLFVLSDAGMGKSSLLVILKVASITVFWPKDLVFHLLRLGPSTLEEIRAVDDRRRTVLLLDALDEDPTAFGRVEERIRELLLEAVSFYRVIITCRTQFFPESGEVPIEAFGRVEVAGFVCNLVYLSPFSDEQASLYLRRLYPDSFLDTIRRLSTGKENSRITTARDILPQMKSLVMRPLLLAYIDDLASVGPKAWRTFRVYEALIDTWLLREERKQSWRGKGPTREQLRLACETIAIYLQERGKRELSPFELESLVSDHPETQLIGTFELGGRSLLNRNSAGAYRFSHYSIQEYLVARVLIHDRERVVVEELRITEELFGFITSWVSEAPAERWKQVWDILRLDPESALVVSSEFRNTDFTGTPHLRTLLATVKNRDFEGSRFVGVDLSTAELSRARMAFADLRQANLSYADFTSAIFLKANMEVCQAESAKLGSAVLTGAKLVGANLKGADLSFAMLKDADLTDADVSNADLTFCDLRGANLTGVVGLTQTVLENTHGDERTALPEGFAKPRRWTEGSITPPQTRGAA